MRKYEDSVSSAVTGLPVYLAEIQLLTSGDAPVAAQLYSDNGVTPLTQPALTDGLGLFNFYVADGTYTLIVADPGGTNPRTFTNIEIYEDARNVSVPIGEAGVTIPSVGARASLNAAYDAAGLPIAVPPLAGPTGPPGAPGAGVNSPSGLAGNGITNDRAIIAAYDAALGTGKEFWLPAGTYRIASNLTVTNLVRFMKGARIQPDAGVTVTFSGGVVVDPTAWVFDVSRSAAYCWALSGRVTQFSYGAIGDGATDDRYAFQMLVDNQLYFQHAAIQPYEGLHKWASTVYIDYGSVINDYRGANWIGPGIKYNGGSPFAGLSIEYTGFENAIEVTGARAFLFTGTELRGPFISMFNTTQFGSGSLPATDPRVMANWLPAGANALCLSRYKMCSGIHIDPRCGTKPTASAWIASTTYSFGTSVTLGGNLYVQYQWPSGVSAGSGGPTGTGASPITDGTCGWKYAGPSSTSIAYTDTTYPAYSGATTQYDKPLSSRVMIMNASIFGFGTNLAVKGCNADGNADFINLYNVQINQGVFGWAWGHTQARLQGAIDCGFGEAHTQISTGVIGKQQGQADCVLINTQVGNCFEVVNVPNASVGGGVQLIGCYGEVCNRFGDLISNGPSGAALSIKGGVYAFQQDKWWAVPESVVDFSGTEFFLDGHVQISGLHCPLLLKGDPNLCRIEAEVTNPLWMGDPTPASVTVAEAIMRRSTMDVVFVGLNQGPWQGIMRSPFQYSVTTGGSRGVQNAGTHARSDVATPIPFCARTATGSYHDSTYPYPVALGNYQQEITAGSITSYSQALRVGTLTLNAGPTLSNAMNLGQEKGGIVYHLQSGNLYVITNRVGAVLTLKALNNWLISTGAPTVAIAGAGTGNWYFTPTGHYVPDKGYELTYTSAAATPTMALSDGTTAGSALQFPAGAVKCVNNEADAMTPVLRANSAVSSVVDGTITLAGNARRTTVERAGLWFVPR